MGGSGGRIEALSELNTDSVPLVGVDVSKAFLQGVSLPSARSLRSNFNEADERNSNFSSADLSYALLNGENFRNSDLQRAPLVVPTSPTPIFAERISVMPISQTPGSIPLTWEMPTSAVSIGKR